MATRGYIYLTILADCDLVISASIPWSKAVTVDPGTGLTNPIRARRKRACCAFAPKIDSILHGFVCSKDSNTTGPSASETLIPNGFRKSGGFQFPAGAIFALNACVLADIIMLPYGMLERFAFSGMYESCMAYPLS